MWPKTNQPHNNLDLVIESLVEAEGITSHPQNKHALESHMHAASREQQIWVKWNLFLWVCVYVCVCVCGNNLASWKKKKKNHLTAQLSESVSTLPASKDQFPVSPPML